MSCLIISFGWGILLLLSPISFQKYVSVIYLQNFQSFKCLENAIRRLIYTHNCAIF